MSTIMIQRNALFTLSMLVANAANAGEPSSYAGWQGRSIKALSAEQSDDLRSGRGMSLALPAELNGYPGPRHVLDLADELDLTADQRAKTQQLFDAMQAEAIALGEQVIAGEAALDELFASGRASDAEILAAAVEAGGLQGALRGHHLRYHVAMREFLSPHQLMRYQELRGYASEGGQRHGQHGGMGTGHEHR
jgi:Spy/CpxP family protein refolding chaperone